MIRSGSYEIVNFLVVFFSIFFLIYVLEVILSENGVSDYIRFTIEIIAFYAGLFLAYVKRKERHILINTILRLTFIGGIILSARSKVDADERDTRVLLMSLFLPALMFSAYTIIFLLGKFFSINLIPVPEYTKALPYPSISLSPESLSELIIFTNISLVAILIFGSFLLLTASFLSLLLNSALLTSLMIYSSPSTTFDLIFPNGLLEIAGIFISTQVGILFLYYLLASLRKNIDSKARIHLRFILNSALYLTCIILLLFLLAWGVEFFNITGYTSGSHTFAPILTYRFIVASDMILIIGIAYIVLLMVREKYVNLMRYSFFLIFPSILIAITFPSLKSHDSLPIYSIILMILSIFYLLSDISREYQKWHFRFDNLNLVKSGVGLMASSGRSMSPTLTDGDLLMVRKISEDVEVRVGDIVVFTPRITQAGLTMERYIAHRVVEIGDSRIVTKGDAHSFRDPWTPIENLSGKVIGKVLSGKNKENLVLEPLGENDEDINLAKEIFSSDEFYHILNSGESKNSAGRKRFSRVLIVTAISIMIPVAIFML